MHVVPFAREPNITALCEMDLSPGLINKTYMLYIDIVDEAGGIATIATILAMEGTRISDFLRSIEIPILRKQ